jgi:ATP-binding cassette subfamily C protein LapB
MAGHAQRQWGEWSNSAIGLAVQSVTVMIMIAGVYQMANGAMTIGALIACSLIAGRALTPIATATAILGRAHQALAQFAGLAQLIALPPESDAPKASIVQGQLRGAMEFRRVSFAYEDGGRPVLNDVSLSIRLGERVAVIGKSGSGKSTLLQLASALVQPTQGAILYDGFAADQYGVSRVRAGISFASQDAIVFDATLKENILLGVHAARDEDIALALRISGADQVAASLAEGFGTKLGHRGAHLSGGQRQQVLLARALVRAAPFLILDEPTSALDAGAEARIRDGLQSLPRDRTLIISTHRMELLSAVDRVIWLEEGRIIADQPAAAVIQRLRGAPSSPVAQSTVKAS